MGFQGSTFTSSTGGFPNVTRTVVNHQLNTQTDAFSGTEGDDGFSFQNLNNGQFQLDDFVFNVNDLQAGQVYTDQQNVMAFVVRDNNGNLRLHAEKGNHFNVISNGQAINNISLQEVIQQHGGNAVMSDGQGNVWMVNVSSGQVRPLTSQEQQLARELRVAEVADNTVVIQEQMAPAPTPAPIPQPNLMPGQWAYMLQMWMCLLQQMMGNGMPGQGQPPGQVLFNTAQSPMGPGGMHYPNLNYGGYQGYNPMNHFSFPQSQGTFGLLPNAQQNFPGTFGF
ncbi:MAG: hypothetical protein SFZ03_07970 [Candidatus Melainabacteria bacterium]|nr:hypothetical protein [Candidatus Melainabacteria bacterium]